MPAIPNPWGTHATQPNQAEQHANQRVVYTHIGQWVQTAVQTAVHHSERSRRYTPRRLPCDRAMPTPRPVVPVLRSCQSPTWIWLVNDLHLHYITFTAQNPQSRDQTPAASRTACGHRLRLLRSVGKPLHAAAGHPSRGHQRRCRRSGGRRSAGVITARHRAAADCSRRFRRPAARHRSAAPYVPCFRRSTR